MRVLVIDDYDLVRNSITRLLMENSIEVAGEASDGLEALEKALGNYGRCYPDEH